MRRLALILYHHHPTNQPTQQRQQPTPFHLFPTQPFRCGLDKAKSCRPEFEQIKVCVSPFLSNCLIFCIVLTANYSHWYRERPASLQLCLILTTRSRSLKQASVSFANYATPSLGHRGHYLLKHSTHSIDPL